MLKKRKATGLQEEMRALLTGEESDLLAAAPVLEHELRRAGLHGSATLMNNVVKYVGYEMAEILKRRHRERMKSER